ncbi:MAG TPA: Ig-like domain-containing protein, partial [Verrucomicrobiae bacterium]
MSTPSTTVQQTINWRSLRHRIMAALVLFSIVPMATRAQLVTNIIYQDNFARTGALDGSAPDTVNLPGANWFACNVPSLNAQIQTDGSELALTNVPGTTNGFYLNGFLPFVPQVGHIYSLSCNIKPISGGSQWLALGFATHPLTNNYFATYQCGSGWLLVRGNGGQIQTWGALTGSSTFTNLIGTNFQTFTVTLDTTTGNSQRNWNIKFYTNNVLVPGGNYTIPWGNYPIKYVGIGADAGQGYFQQFTLTDVLIFSGTPTIVEEPQNTTAQVGQTATFWVGVTNDYPAASYQWMTNSAGGPTNAIPGATNAFYTTPTLDMSYNGLNYSVVITNTLASTNSALAALTVVSGPPTVFSAEKTSNLTNIVVAFSKAIDPATGLNPANYAVTINGASSGVSVLSASYGSASNNVILTTSTLNTNVGYYLVVQNVKDQFGSTMSATANVPVLPAGLVLYLRADSGVVYDGSGSLVAQWRDQTTNANDVLQYFGVPSAGPTYLGPVVRPTTSGFNNGQLAVDFGSTIHWLAAPSTPSLESLTSNTTMYAVANFTGASDDIVNKVWGNLPAPFDWDPNPNENVQYGNGGNNSPAGGIGSSVSLNKPYVLTSMLAFPPASGVTNIFNFWLNGANNGNGSIRPLTDNPPVLWDAGFPLWVGARWDLINPRMRGQIAEIMLFNTAISA